MFKAGFQIKISSHPTGSFCVTCASWFGLKVAVLTGVFDGTQSYDGHDPGFPSCQVVSRFYHDRCERLAPW